jgi:predicted kinase
MPTLTVLVGLPGSGKTTWRKEYLASNPDTVVISQDDLLDAYAVANALTYTEAFQQADLKKIEKQVYALFDEAVAQGQDILLDRTNMTAKGRASFLKRLTEGYEKVAVVFEIDEATLAYRLLKRANAEGKFIPDFVIRNFQETFVAPTEAEFNRVVTVHAPILNIWQRLEHWFLTYVKSRFLTYVKGRFFKS